MTIDGIGSNGSANIQSIYLFILAYFEFSSHGVSVGCFESLVENSLKKFLSLLIKM